MTVRVSSRCAFALGLAALGLIGTPDTASAQSLRGSRASVERMYRSARAKALHFYETHAGVRQATAAGRFVPFRSSSHLVLHRDVTHPVVLPRTRTVIVGLAARYHAACGQRLVLTSATRPQAGQPRNASRKSVHPTGMAVDIRRPSGRCLTWLRRELVAMERKGIVEATEERRPPHFHVAVLKAPASSTRYVVKPGDTLGRIAVRHRTTVERLLRLNGKSSTTIRPGEQLVIG